MRAPRIRSVMSGVAVAALIGGCSAAAKPPSAIKADLSEFKIGTDSARPPAPAGPDQAAQANA